MKVRHVHASSNEYIAVHRTGTSGGAGLFCLIAVIFGVWLFVQLWQFIVICAAIAAGVWLIWVFRGILLKAVCWAGRLLGKLLMAGGRIICRLIGSGWKKFRNGKKLTDSETSPEEYNADSVNYGKIIQNWK